MHCRRYLGKMSVKPLFAVNQCKFWVRIVPWTRSFVAILLKCFSYHQLVQSKSSAFTVGDFYRVKLLFLRILFCFVVDGLLRLQVDFCCIGSLSDIREPLSYSLEELLAVDAVQELVTVA